MNRWAAAVLAIVCLVAVGCQYKSPKMAKLYGKVFLGMSKDDVVKALGPPTATIDNEMWYNYDDPDNAVRLRFILNDKGFVTERFYETKKELAKKAEEAKVKTPATSTLPGEEKRTYPGGPLERFEKKPGMP